MQGRVVRARCRNCGSTIDVAKLTQASQRGAHTRTPGLYQASSSVSAAKVRQYRAPYQDTYEAQRERPHAEQASYEQAPQYAPSYEQADHDEQLHGHDEPHEEPPTHAFESPVFRRGNDAARRTDARPKRDLFAPTPPEDVPAIREVHAPIARVAGGSGAVGQRAENSVLFTLAALEPPKRRAETAKAAAPADDHSGMIDLFAIARAAKTSSEASSPLFATEPPLGAFTTELAPPFARTTHPGRRKKKARLLAAGAVSALITGLAVFLFIGASSDAPVAKAAPKPVAVAAAAPAAVAPPAAAAAPGDPALIAVSAKTSAAPAARGKGKAAKPSHRAGAPAVTRSRAATAPAASDPCHCRGNLLCAMKCSV